MHFKSHVELVIVTSGKFYMQNMPLISSHYFPTHFPKHSLATTFSSKMFLGALTNLNQLDVSTSPPSTYRSTCVPLLICNNKIR